MMRDSRKRFRYTPRQHTKPSTTQLRPLQKREAIFAIAMGEQYFYFMMHAFAIE